MNSPPLSIVLPCYNEAKNIPLVLKRFREIKGNRSFELILVNNGSTDNSADVLKKELHMPDNQFARTVLIEKNQGYGHGIYTGLLAAKGDYLAFSHADMQCDPKNIFTAYDLLIQQADPTMTLVKGFRQGRSFFENIVTKTCQWVAVSILWVWLYDINGQPKVFHRSFLKNLEGAPAGFEFDVFVLYKMRKKRMKLLDVPVPFPPRLHGFSNWAANWRSRLLTILRFIRYVMQLRVTP